MSNILVSFLLVFSMLLGGCGRSGEKQLDPVTTKKRPGMIQIQDLEVTDKTLNLTYQISNPFEDDIRICEDISPYGSQHAATRIDGKYVWIRLRLYREHETKSYIDAHPTGFGKYLRLSPGESYSGRIVLDLPIRDGFPDQRGDSKLYKQIILDRLIFEIGYFGPQYGRLFEGMAKIPEMLGLKIEPVSGSYELPTSVLVVQETQEGQLQEVVYIRRFWAELRLEESAKVLITDVNIPCSVVVDE